MKRVGVLSLVVVLSATGAFAGIALNGVSLNGVSLNRIALNGVSLNSESSGVATPVVVQAITLADGTLLTVEPVH